jgi:hypothetical protein
MINQRVSIARKTDGHFIWDELDVIKAEPLREELIAFAHLIREEDSGIALGSDGRTALALATAINDVMITPA